MKQLIFLFIALIWMSPAFADLTRTSDQHWKEYDKAVVNIPVPTGWNVDSQSGAFYQRTFAAFPTDPRIARDGWYYEGLFVEHYSTGLPNEAQDIKSAINLLIRNSTSNGKDLEIISDQPVGNGHATIFEITGPDGTRSRDIAVMYPVILPGNDQITHVRITVFTEDGNWQNANAISLAAKVAQALSAAPEVVQGVEDLIKAPEPTPQSAPYDPPADMQLVKWRDKGVLMPAGWIIQYFPLGQSKSHLDDVKITASPNPDDPDAPMFYYFHVARPQTTGALSELNAMIENAKTTYSDYEVNADAAFGSWACIDESYTDHDGSLAQDYFCTTVSDGIQEGFGYTVPPDAFDRRDSRQKTLSMFPDFPIDLLTEDHVLPLDTVKSLLTTRAIPPFPPLVPINAQRAPAGWQAELDFATGEMRYVEQDDSAVPATLIQRARLDTSEDAEVVLTNYIEDWGVTDFELIDSAYIPDNKGIFVEGKGKIDGEDIKIGMMAEQSYSITYAFIAPPEKFDAYGGTSLLGPVFLEIRPDGLQDIAQPAERTRLIAEEFGTRLAARRKLDFDMKMWSMKTQTETMIHASRAFMYSMSCGGMCY